MEKILDFLIRLNLSETEAKLYLTLLETGPSSVRDIAQRIGVKRTTTYLYIDNLMNKGLIVKNVINSRTQIASIQPSESLSTLVKENANHAQEIELKLPEILKDIHTAIPLFKEVETFEIKHYQNINGIKKIYEDALKANELRSYIKLIENDPIFSDNVTIFNQAFKNNKELTVKEILYESSTIKQDAQEILAQNNTRYSYKFMPEDMKLTSEDILMYDGKVAIIHYRGKENCNCIVLQSSEYYNNSKEFFDFIWKTLPESTQ